MSQYFTRVANEVLKASEEISARMEDGIAAMIKGELPKQDGGGASSSFSSRGAEDAAAAGDDFLIDDEEDLMDSSPLQGIAESVIGELMQNSAKPEGIAEQFQAFRSAITWSEPFIMALVAFQILLFILSIMASRSTVGLAPRLTLMVFIALVVRTAEYWNAYASQHWQKIATQNYFDRQGVFVAIMVSAPLLMDCLIMLLCFVREAATLLVTVKRNEIKRKRAEQSKANKATTKKEQ